MSISYKDYEAAMMNARMSDDYSIKDIPEVVYDVLKRSGCLKREEIIDAVALTTSIDKVELSGKVSHALKSLLKGGRATHPSTGFWRAV